MTVHILRGNSGRTFCGLSRLRVTAVTYRAFVSIEPEKPCARCRASVLRAVGQTEDRRRERATV